MAGSAVIGTLAALVLGLMVSSASKNFDALNGGLTENAASYIDLDRVLAQYGKDANTTRDLLTDIPQVAYRLTSTSPDCAS